MINYISTVQLNINNHVLSIRETFTQGYFPNYGDEFAPIHLHSLTQFSLSPTAHICQPAGWGESISYATLQENFAGLHQDETHDLSSLTIWTATLS